MPGPSAMAVTDVASGAFCHADVRVGGIETAECGGQAEAEPALVPCYYWPALLLQSIPNASSTLPPDAPDPTA